VYALLPALAALLLAGCHNRPPVIAGDYHSYSNPHQALVRHLELDLEADFAGKVLKGAAALDLVRVAGDKLVLDTRDLKINKVEAAPETGAFSETGFEIGPADPILGSPLSIELPPAARRVRIRYSTSPGASGLQWLEPRQTAGRESPFLFTQSQAIHARSWIPLQDTPGVRITYTAQVRTPAGLRAVMSAENDPAAPRNGSYSFRMPQAIPSYLIALAVGDLEFRSLGRRTGVYAETPVLERAAREFEDTEKMIDAVEGMYGPYRWGRYDLLVLPPSFPYGGMENPRLTFATPTILAGDKSLVNLVAHELAHSWSGNLVTNATWSDFWLNEGFTVYLERRIVEKVYGPRMAAMEAVLGYQDLLREMEKLEDRDEILHIDLKGRDPDANVTQVPYEKGALFLQDLERAFGRERFDAFLRGYFGHFAFQSVTTEQFLAYLRENLLEPDRERAARVPLEEWIHRPGLPAGAPRPGSDAFEKVGAQAARWLKGEIPAGELPVESWSTYERLHFLRALPEKLQREKMRQLDRAFALTRAGNSEILQQWLLMSIRNGYEPAFRRLEEFLGSVGRRKYLKPLYEELVKTPAGRSRAERVYGQARSGYHPIAQASVDAILKR